MIAAHRRALPPPGPRPVLLELTDEEALARALDRLRPEAVVHAAAIGRADHCQERPDEAERVNARLPGALARLCRESGLRLVALSTDLVLAGDRAFAREDAAPGPLNVYGRTKLAGEEAVLAAFPEAAVARVALVAGRGHGPRGTSTESVAWALREGRAVRLFTDEHRTPVDAESLADALLAPARAGRGRAVPPRGARAAEPLRAGVPRRPGSRPSGDGDRGGPAGGVRGGRPPDPGRLARLVAGAARARLGAPADRRGDPEGAGYFGGIARWKVRVSRQRVNSSPSLIGVSTPVGIFWPFR